MEMTMVIPSPRKGGNLAPLQGVPLWHSLFQKERAALRPKVSQALVKVVKHGTCASLHSNGHGVATARRTKVSPGNLPLPFSTTRLFGAKAQALISTNCNMVTGAKMMA